MEPPDLWEKYLEPKFRERAIRIVKDPGDGLEVLMVDNQPLLKGMLAGLGGANQPRQELFIPGRLGYMDGCPSASYLPAERVRLLDQWGVNAGVLFPTVGILWDVEDHELAAAYARAYNNWINDFASSVRSRVIPIAHIALQDVESALAELKRCIMLGFKGIFLAPENVGGRRFSHPDFDPIWRECEEAGIPACLHVIVRFNRPPGIIGQFYQPGEFRTVFGFALGGFAQVVPAAMTMVADGLFDRFPRLKVLCVEAGMRLGALYNGQDGSEVRPARLDLPYPLEAVGLFPAKYLGGRRAGGANDRRGHGSSGRGSRAVGIGFSARRFQPRSAAPDSKFNRESESGAAAQTARRKRARRVPGLAHHVCSTANDIYRKVAWPRCRVTRRRKTRHWSRPASRATSRYQPRAQFRWRAPRTAIASSTSYATHARTADGVRRASSACSHSAANSNRIRKLNFVEALGFGAQF